MTIEDKADITNDLLSRIPAYGEFEILYDNKMAAIITATFPYNDVRESVEKALSDGAALAQRMADEQLILQELIFGGFIINRHDIKVEGKIYRQLTDSGRELKELGSMESYKRVQQEKAAKILADDDHRAMEVLRNKRLYYVTWSLAISTAIAALYYLKELWVSFFGGLN